MSDAALSDIILGLITNFLKLQLNFTRKCVSEKDYLEKSLIDNRLADIITTYYQYRNWPQISNIRRALVCYNRMLINI